MNGLLVKLSDNENDLRTSEVRGSFKNLPTVGKSFQMFASALDPNATFRVVTTSIVQDVIQVDNCYVIQTLNSLYRLEVDE